MIDYYKEHWYFLLILLALAALTVFVWIKALERRTVRKRKRDAEIALLDTQKAALAAYEAWVVDRNVPITDAQLVIGRALSVQKLLQHEPDQEVAFAQLSADTRQAYALFYALLDTPGKLSHFFRQYGAPLTTAARDAVLRFVPPPAAQIFVQMFDAFDPDNETASLIPTQVTEWDAAFANALDLDRTLHAAAMRGEE
ncbi:MAG: hypothetical protein LBN05_00105 [Oscillospiraceae bacterium]|nr:hypothetical protein [Oscillospiraceae bacterium]